MMLDNSADASAAATGATATAAAEEVAHDSSGGGSGDAGGAGAIPSGFSEDDKARIEEGERGGGGNRWPRQETLALLKIRSEMDEVFRDSSLKGPLWEDVSRKMAELGYQRSSKKCKEKFENVFKYHKRTKEGRASKADGKTYRFFDQLAALESNPPLQLPPPQRTQPPMATAATMAVPIPASSNPPISSHGTVSSAPLSPNPVSFAQNFVSQSISNPIPTIPSIPPSQSQLPPPQTTNATHPPLPIPLPSNTYPPPPHHISASMFSNSSSSSTSSDEEIGRRHSRKRKWKDFFERLMKNVIDKQEELQKKFLETLEKRERDRMIREEAWRVQEMARMNREHDLLVQERSMAAAKDAAVIAFLQKVTNQQNQQNPNSTNAIQIPVQLQLPENPLPPPPAPPSISVSIPQATPAKPIPPPASAPPPAAPALQAPSRNVDTSPKTGNGIQNFLQPSSSRWPKSEVQALIRLRTDLDVKYQENGPKGPLWEEISAGMRKLGYNRNSKRCKEKWENINKYFKKVKESNKKRPEDSKTCPYFHQLEALYKEKALNVKPENAPTVPIMARPEQQWPVLQQQDQQQQEQLHQQQQEQLHQQQQEQLPPQHLQQDRVMEDRDHESDNIDENDHEDDDEEEEDDDEGEGYEIVTNKQPSSVATSVA